MKRYLLGLFLVVFFFATVFSFNLGISSVSAATPITTISQLIELLINIGVIAPSKADAARAVAITLSQATSTVGILASTTPYIQVLSPNGGENWSIDTDVKYTISWGTSMQIPVTVAFVSSGGLCNLNLQPIISKATTNSYSTLLKTTRCYNLANGSSTALIAGSYKVRVYYTSPIGKVTSDDSNSAFRISAPLIPSLTVTYPNGGESLQRGHDYTVKYTVKDGDFNDYVELYLLDSTGEQAHYTRKIYNKSGTFSLSLPSSITPGAYKVKLVSWTVNRVEVQDISNNFFWISNIQ